MPRRPSKADMQTYNVEAFIQRKVKLISMCEDDLDILREDPEGSAKAIQELRKKYRCSEGDLPPRREDAQVFLKKCERLVEQPVTSHAERHARAGAAFTLVTHMIKLEANFPNNVRFYILSEYTKRLDEIMPDPSDDDLELLPRECWPEHIRRRIDAEACKTVDEQTAEAFLNDVDFTIHDRTFIVPGEGPEDTVTFRVLGNELTTTNPMWKVFYGDSYIPVKMDSAKLKDLLIDTIAYRDY